MLDSTVARRARARPPAGLAKGPVLPFGFDIGMYAEESEGAFFPSPELQTARTQMLDYFAARPAPFASRSVRRALLTPQVNFGSLYCCGGST